MDSQSSVINRVEKALGPAAATMFVESGTTDRHFVIETLVTMVALYLGGKFLDGFVEGFVDGAGVPELGKKIGAKAKGLIGFSHHAIKSPESIDHTEMQRQIEELTHLVAELSAYRSDAKAMMAGVSKVREALKEQGLPSREAEKISLRIEVALWNESL